MQQASFAAVSGGCYRPSQDRVTPCNARKSLNVATALRLDVMPVSGFLTPFYWSPRHGAAALIPGPFVITSPWRLLKLACDAGLASRAPQGRAFGIDDVLGCLCVDWTAAGTLRTLASTGPTKTKSPCETPTMFRTGSYMFTEEMTPRLLMISSVLWERGSGRYAGKAWSVNGKSPPRAHSSAG